MTATQLAAVIMEVYYAGRVKETAMRLELRDFVQLVNMATVDAVRKAYQEDKLLGGMTNTLSDMIRPYRLDITTDEFGRKIAKFPEGVSIMSLPDSAGVQSVTPLGKGLECTGIVRGVPGSEWLFCGLSDYPVFLPYDTYIVFHNLPDCVKQVMANLVATGDQTPVSDEVAWPVAKAVWQQVSRTIALPIDKVNDWNPNAEEYLRTRLSSPEING